MGTCPACVGQRFGEHTSLLCSGNQNWAQGNDHFGFQKEPVPDLEFAVFSFSVEQHDREIWLCLTGCKPVSPGTAAPSWTLSLAEEQNPDSSHLYPLSISYGIQG